MLSKIKNPYIRNIQIGLYCGIIGCLGHNLVSVNLRWTSTATSFWFIFGLSAALCYSVKSRITSFKLNFDNLKNKIKKFKEDELFRFGRYFLIAILSVVFIGYLAYCIVLTKSDFFLKQGMRIDYAPFPQPENYDNDDIYQQQLNQYINILNSCEYSLRKSLVLYPFDLSSFYKIGYVYLQNGNILASKNKIPQAIDSFHKAQDMYNEIIKLAPNYAQIHNNIGMLYQRLMNENPHYKYRAMRQFEWATTLENNQRNHNNLINFYINISRDFSRGFYHKFKIKEINREERQKTLSYYLYYYYFSPNEKFYNNNTQKFYNYTNSFYTNIRELATFKDSVNDTKLALGWINLATDFVPENNNFIQMKMSLFTKYNMLDSATDYFDLLNNTLEQNQNKINLFKGFDNLFQIFANQSKSNKNKATAFLYRAKIFKIIGDKRGTQYLANEAQKLDPDNNIIKKFLENN
jgi:hypothetical protein